VSKTEEAVERLAKVDLFEGLPENVLLRIALLGQIVECQPGEAIVHEDDTGGALFLIFEGEAVVSVKGQERARLGSGDYFGEVSLLDGGPRSATVSAVSPVRAFTLASFSFRPLLAEHPEVTDKVIYGLCQRLREAEAELTT
jgi:CRP-like cAMP-binding protein